MKIQLDTTNKTIRLDESVRIGELVLELDKILPEGLWREFTLEVNNSIDWVTYPIYPIYPYGDQTPFDYPWGNYYYGTSGGTTIECDNSIVGYSVSDVTLNQDVPYTLTSGTYNIEILK